MELPVSRVSPIMRDAVDGSGRKYLTFWCPGCEGVHQVQVAEGGWGWNGSFDLPTFTPSILVTYNGSDAGQLDDDGSRAPYAVCHSFVTDGRIQFLGDCTHPLAGQTVDLPEFDC